MVRTVGPRLGRFGGTSRWQCDETRDHGTGITDCRGEEEGASVCRKSGTVKDRCRNRSDASDTG